MKQIIQITNNTKESTKMLKKLTKFIAQSKGITENIQIKFSKSRHDCCCGRAFVGSVFSSGLNDNKKGLDWHKSLKIRLPLCWKNKLPEVIAVIQHEFDHTLGLRHKDMFWNRQKVFKEDPAKYISVGYLEKIRGIVNE